MTVAEEVRNGEPDLAASLVNIKSSTKKLGDNELFPESESNQLQMRQQGALLPTAPVETSKKRSAERQIVKGDPQEATDDEHCPSGNSCNDAESESFPKAPIEELKRRRIFKVKASNKAQPPPIPSLKIPLEEGNDGVPTAPSSNDLNIESSKPLTENTLSATKSTGGFGKFSSVNPFMFPLSNNEISLDPGSNTAGGFRSSLITSGGFGSIFTMSSSETATSGFGSFAAAAAALERREKSQKVPNGEERLRGEHEVVSQEKYNTEGINGISENPVFTLPSTLEEFNGEENEECILQIRAKLYRLSCCKTVRHEEEELNKESPEKKTGSPISDTKQSSTFSWREVGTGPLRVLQLRQEHKGAGELHTKNTSTRVVQRRESTPGGSGTKVILNVPIRRETVVHRQGDKHVMLSTISCEVRNRSALFVLFLPFTTLILFLYVSTTMQETSASASYLFKVKTADDANILFNCLEKAISDALETTPSLQDGQA